MKIEVLSSSSAGNAYIVTDGTTTLLLEAGLPWKLIQEKSGFRKIDAVFISHQHMDHAKGLLTAATFGIDIYTSKAVIDGLKTKRYNVMAVKSMQQFKVGTFVIMPFDVEHDVECYGYLIYSETTRKKLVFITDTCYCRHTFKDVNYWLLECNHARDIIDRNVRDGIIPQSLRNRIVKSHMSLDTLKKLLQANDLSKTEEIWLIHLSGTNADPARFKDEVQRCTGKAVYLA